MYPWLMKGKTGVQKTYVLSERADGNAVSSYRTQRGVTHSPAMRTTLPSSSLLANGRYSVTVRYAGINNADPMRNMARCENLPRGGLQGVRTARQPSIGSDLPDVPAEELARLPVKICETHG